MANSSSNNRNSNGRSRRPAPKPTGWEKFVKAITFGAVDPFEKRKNAGRSRKPSSDRKPAAGKSDRGPKKERKFDPPQAPDTPRLYVGNLNYDTADEDLQKLFSDFGTVNSAAVVTRGDSGRSKGFGFVEMDDLEAAKAAVAKLHGNEFMGRKIIVNGAKAEKPRRDSNSGERSERRERKPRQREERSSEDRPRRERKSRGERGQKREPHPGPKPLEIEQVSSPSLVVGPIINEATEEDITDLFDGIGSIQTKVESGDSNANAPTREFRIDLASTEEAQKAVELLHNKSFMGEKLSVKGASSTETPVEPVAETPAEASTTDES